MRLNPSTDVFAAPWSLPGWMKANDALNNIDYRGALLPSDFAVAAGYYVRFIRAYAQAGVPVSAIAPINEGGTPSEYRGMNLDDEPEFITGYLVPALRAGGLGTAVYDLDGTGFANEEQWLANPAYRSTIAGTAVHCYADLEQMSGLHEINPAGSLVMTECSPGVTNYATSETAIASLRNFSQAVILWNLALDPYGGQKQHVPGCAACYGLVTVDQNNHRAELNLNYYQLGQVSKFVRRGAVRIASTRWVSDYASSGGIDYGVTPGLDNVALENPDGSEVLVVYDNSLHPIHFQVAWDARGFTYTLGAGATVTFTW